MSSQRYASIPSSPPPSFRSRDSSPSSPSRTQHFFSESDPLTSDVDRTLADTFDSPSDDEDDDDHAEPDDRQRLMRGQASTDRDDQDEHNNASPSQNSTSTPPRRIERRVTQLPVFVPNANGGRVYGGGNTNDGVFSNLAAKPASGDLEDEKPPSYEAAAADATPPYWETTILAPGMVSDEVYVDGLPVGSIFSFVWNAMISMSFQIVGFLLTYLLHTTHAAKNGSRAGLGITLVQYGFSMKGASALTGAPPPPQQQGDQFAPATGDPNSHDFIDPANDPTGDGGTMATVGGISTTDWLAYVLMIVGWFILIRSVSDYFRARRHEQLVLQSPDRGLGVAVVAEGENPESSV